MGQTKETRQLITRLRAAGLTVTQRRNGHYRITAPNGAHITASYSPRSPERATRNIIADVRRYLGVKL